MNLPTYRRKHSHNTYFDGIQIQSEETRFLQQLLSELQLLTQCLVTQLKARNALECQNKMLKEDLEKSRAESAKLRAKLFKVTQQSFQKKTQTPSLVCKTDRPPAKKKLKNSNSFILDFQQNKDQIRKQLECKNQALKQLWKTYQAQQRKSRQLEHQLQQVKRHGSYFLSSKKSDSNKIKI